MLQTDEENINFFVIEVSEGFSMESIETIFNVQKYLFREWVNNLLSKMSFGCLHSTNMKIILIKLVFLALRSPQLTTGILWDR